MCVSFVVRGCEEAAKRVPLSLSPSLSLGLSPEAEVLTFLSLSHLGVPGWCPFRAGFGVHEAFF